MKSKLKPYSKSIEKSVKKQLTRTLFIQIITDGNRNTTAKSLRLFLRSMKWRKDDKISTDEFYSIYNAFIKLSKKTSTVKQKPITYRIFSSLFMKCSLSDIHQYVKTMQKLPRRHWVLLGIYQKPILKQILKVFRILDWKSCGALTLDELYPFVIALLGKSVSLGVDLNPCQVTERIVDLASNLIQKTNGGLMTFRRFLECFPGDKTQFQKNVISTFENIADSLEKRIFPIYYNHPWIFRKSRDDAEEEKVGEEEVGEGDDDDDDDDEGSEIKSKRNHGRKPKKRKMEESDFLNVLNFWEISSLETHISRCEESRELLEYLLDETAALRGRLGKSIFTKPGQYNLFQSYIENYYEKNRKNSKVPKKTSQDDNKKKSQVSGSDNNKINTTTTDDDDGGGGSFISEEYRNIYSFICSVCEKYRELLDAQNISIVLRDWETVEEERMRRERKRLTYFNTTSSPLISVIRREQESPLIISGDGDGDGVNSSVEGNNDKKIGGSHTLMKDKEVQTIGVSSALSSSIFQDTIREYGVGGQVSIPSSVAENETYMEIKKEFSEALSSLRSLKEKKKTFSSSGRKKVISRKLF